jgi:predicted phage gp36 major capsid-like protein
LEVCCALIAKVRRRVGEARTSRTKRRRTELAVQEMEARDHELDSDATEVLSDAEDAPTGGSKRKHAAHSKATAAATARPTGYVDRLSEFAQQRQRQGGAGSGSAVAGATSVPQVQGVRSSLTVGAKPRGVPINNRQKIMKKLGLKI